MLVINRMSQKLTNAVNWVCEHRVELAISVGSVAIVALRCYMEKLALDREIQFRERCSADSLPVSEITTITETFRYSVLNCGSRVFYRFF